MFQTPCCPKLIKQCNIVYVDPKNGCDKNGQLGNPKNQFQSYRAAARAIRHSDSKPTEFNRWLVKISNCTLRENVKSYSWIDIQGESRQGTFIAGRVIAGKHLTVGTESFVSHLTVHVNCEDLLQVDTLGSLFFQDVRFLRQLCTFGKKSHNCDVATVATAVSIVNLLAGQLTIIDSVITLETNRPADNVSFFTTSGGLPIRLNVRNTRHELASLSKKVGQVTTVMHRNTSSDNSLLSKANVFSITRPGDVPYDHLLSSGGGGTVKSHHDTINFSAIAIPPSIVLSNAGPAVTVSGGDQFFASYFNSEGTLVKFPINGNAGATTSHLVGPNSPPEIVIALTYQFSDGSVVTSPKLAITDAAITYGWAAILDDDGNVVSLTWSNTANTHLVTSIGNGVNAASVEMIDADVHPPAAKFAISRSLGPNARTVAHNIRMHGLNVLPSRGNSEVNGGKSIEHALTTDGGRLLGGQEVSQTRVIVNNNARYLVENDVSIVVVQSQGVFVTLPAIRLTNGQSRHGTRLVVKNGGRGVVGVETTDGSLIDGVNVYSLPPRHSITVLATDVGEGTDNVDTLAQISPLVAGAWHITANVVVPPIPTPSTYLIDLGPGGEFMVLDAGTTFAFPPAPAKYVVLTLVGGGGGAGACGPVIPTPNLCSAGGAAATWQIAIDLSKTSGLYSGLTVNKVGLAGMNDTLDPTPGGDTTVTIVGISPTLDITLTAYGGGAAANQASGISAGGGAGCGGGGISPNGGVSCSGHVGAVGAGGWGGSNNVRPNPTDSQGQSVTQLLGSILHKAPSLASIAVVQNGVPLYLFTPGSGGSSQVVGSSVSSSTVSLYQGVPSEFSSTHSNSDSTTVSYGGTTLGLYPYNGSGGPPAFGFGAVIDTTVSPILSIPAGPGGGGALVNDILGVAPGNGVVMVQVI